MISSLSVNLTRSMTHCRCTRWSKLIYSWSNSSCSIWRACSSCGRAVVRWICHACPTGLVLIILFFISKIERKLKFQLQKKYKNFLQASKWTLKTEQNGPIEIIFKNIEFFQTKLSIRKIDLAACKNFLQLNLQLVLQLVAQA